jgi:hypothetical protein
MSEPWRPFFEVYKTTRPGAQHNGWNPERVFEAGFVAGMVHWAALTENLEQVTPSDATAKAWDEGWLNCYDEDEDDNPYRKAQND